MVEIGLGFIIHIYYYFEIYRFIMILKFLKNYFKIVGKKKDGNDMAADMAQRERSNI